MSNPRVVLLHDWLTGYRGGERVLEAFCEIFPNAPIYTLLHKKESTSDLLESKNIKTSFLNSIPGIEKHYRKFLPLFPLAAQSIHIKENADIVLSSSHAAIKAVKKPRGSIHISYIHSPMRYLYDQFDVYFGPNTPITQRIAMKLLRKPLTLWDIQSNSNVDLMIANSQFVQERIRKYYARDSELIYPFVELKDFQENKNLLEFQENREPFYLMVTAFAPNKRVDLAIKAFNQLGRNLKIIGSGQQEQMLRSLANKNIEFLGNLPRSAVIENLIKAQALVFPGIEDFGITPLEALAAGTPVVAYGAGGVLETLNDSVAQFFVNPNVEDLVQAVREFEKRKFSTEILKKRAADFSKEKFKAEIALTVDLCLKNRLNYVKNP